MELRTQTFWPWPWIFPWALFASPLRALIPKTVKQGNLTGFSQRTCPLLTICDSESEINKEKNLSRQQGILKLAFQLHLGCRCPLVFLNEGGGGDGRVSTLWCEDNLRLPCSFLKGHTGAPSCWVVHTAYYYADTVISFMFLLLFFFFPLSPSEISQSDSLEKIEANAFDSLLNLSEM